MYTTFTSRVTITMCSESFGFGNETIELCFLMVGSWFHDYEHYTTVREKRLNLHNNAVFSATSHPHSEVVMHEEKFLSNEVGITTQGT